MNRPKVGLLTLFFDLYLTSGDALLTSCSQFAKELAEGMQNSADVCFPGVCSNRDEVNTAVARFETEDVDLIVIVFLTYTPSMYALPALLRTQKPLLLFCTQKMPAVTDAISSWDTEENHGVHGFQDLANVLRRAGRPYHFLTGYWKEPHVREALDGWFQAARVRRTLANSSIGIIGNSMENMGDFGVDETAFQTQLGLHVHHLSMQQIAKLAKDAPEGEIHVQMAADKEAFQVLPMVTESQHEIAARLEWALRITMQTKKLLGFASHFFSVGEEGWLDSLPFLAASKLLGEGYSFGGEGDVTSVAAVTVLQLLVGQANFTEIFTIDFGGGTVLMSHMGEGNWKMAREDYPVFMRSDPFDMVPLRVNPVSLTFTLRPGPVTLLNITTGPGGKLNWIVAQGNIPDEPPLPNVVQVHNKFKPMLPVEEFLTRYGMEGGSHHQGLAYGSHIENIKKLAAMMNIPLIVI